MHRMVSESYKGISRQCDTISPVVHQALKGVEGVKY